MVNKNTRRISVANRRKTKKKRSCAFAPACPNVPALKNCINLYYPVLNGYDVISYHTKKAYEMPDKGSRKYSCKHNKYKYYFKSKKNKNIFLKDPSKYVPQYGGFCAWGVVAEFAPKFPWSGNCLGPSIALNNWLIYKNKLYLFLNDAVRKLFKNDIDKNIKVADKRFKRWFKNKKISSMNTTCIFDDYTKLIYKQ